MSDEKKTSKKPVIILHPKDRAQFGDKVADLVIKTVNAERKKKGLPPLPKE